MTGLEGDALDDGADLAERIIEAIADAVIFADGKGTIRRFNPAAAALFGFSAEEALGQSLDLLIPEHLRGLHWRGFDAAMTNGKLKLEGRPTLTRGQHKSGRKLYVEMTFALVTADGEALGAVAVARDATERVERERAAAQSGAGRARPQTRDRPCAPQKSSTSSPVTPRTRSAT